MTEAECMVLVVRSGAGFIEKVRNEDGLRAEKLTFVRTFLFLLVNLPFRTVFDNSRSSIKMCGLNGDIAVSDESCLVH